MITLNSRLQGPLNPNHRWDVSWNSFTHYATSEDYFLIHTQSQAVALLTNAITLSYRKENRSWEILKRDLLAQTSLEAMVQKIYQALKLSQADCPELNNWIQQFCRNFVASEIENHQQGIATANQRIAKLNDILSTV